MKFTFLKLKTRFYLKRNKTTRINLPYKQASQVGIIFTVEDKVKHDAIKELVRNLERDGKKVKVVSFLPKYKENYDFMFDFFTEKDISFWGNITSTPAMRFAVTGFDFLYCLDTTPNPLVLNLVARSKARCRVGKHWVNKRAFFEMMVEHDSDTKTWIDTLYRYTRSLQ